MIGLPVCPYCHTVYGYKDVLIFKGKTGKCYHCKKEFYVSKKMRIVPVLVVCLILIVFNLIVFNTSRDIRLEMIAITDIVCIFASLMTAPYMTRFRKIKK